MQERKVTVYDKNGKRIAVFSNSTSIHTEEGKRNIMVSPTIDITSNGASTLTFQMLVNSTKWQQIKNPENLYYCNGRVYTALNEQSIVYNGQIVNVTLVERWYLLAYQYVQVHNVDTTIESLDEHTVKILPKTASNFKLTVNGVAYDDSEVMDSRGVIQPRGSAGYALWGLLKGTDWKLGVCDVIVDGFDAANDYGTFNVETDMKDVLQNIQFVQQLYGGILDWDSENKILNFRDEKKDSDFNRWKGFSIRKGKNLAENPQITWDNSLITRLYPLGNGNLNIKKVNNGKNYIENFSYTNAVYSSYLQNANIYDTNDESGQKTLMFWGQQQLEKYCKPRKSISYNIVDMRGTEEYSFETFDINDIVKAYYPDTETGNEIFEYLRIQHLSYNYFYPDSSSVIEVGDKVSNESEIFFQVYKKTEDSAPTDQNGNISGSDIYLEVPEEYWDELFGGGFGYASLQDITNLHAEHETENTVAIADLRVYADDTFATITSFTAFQEETEEGFRQSSTRIDQVSTALNAQIELEALHHEESLEYTQESVANLKLYVDGDFALAQLNAAYAYADQKAETLSNSIAEFRAYADRTYALASVSASYEYVDNVKNALNQDISNISRSLSEFSAYADRTYATSAQLSQYSTISQTGQMISQSEASIRTYVTQNFASASIAAKVESFEGVYKYAGSGGGAYVYVDNENVTLEASNHIGIGGGSTRVSIKGFEVKWVNGYLKQA